MFLPSHSLKRSSGATRRLSTLPVVAVLASVSCGVVTVVLELAFAEMVLAVLLNIVGSTCPLVWTSALLAQLALRLHVDPPGHGAFLADGSFHVTHALWPAHPREIFTVGFTGDDSRPELLILGLVALLAVANWVNHRSCKVESRLDSSDGGKQPVLIDRISRRKPFRACVRTEARMALARRPPRVTRTSRSSSR